MVEYICNRCGYNAKQKINLMRHLNRKNICSPILEDISVEEIKFTYGFEMCHNDSKMTPNESKMAPFGSKMNPNDIAPNYSKLLQNYSSPAPNCSILLQNSDCKATCEYCLKTFSRNSNLTKHLKTCKKKKENENEKDKKIEELIKNQEEMKEQMKEMVEKLLVNSGGNTITNNNTNNTNNTNNSTNNSNNTTNNMTNNIIIHNYGDEDTKYITSDYILKLLKNKPAKVIPELIKYTHFNEEHPENQNIKITNKKEPYIKVRKNDKWELQNKDETINDLIDRQQIHLMDENIEKKIEETCNSSEKINIERCKDLYDEDDKEFMKRVYSESELIIINNS
jgi:hypothetical protein